MRQRGIPRNFLSLALVAGCLGLLPAASGHAAAAEHPLATGTPVFLRQGDTAAMIRFALARDDAGQPAALVLAGDGRSHGAQRLTAVLAEGQPRGQVLAAVWVRAAEGLDESAFAAFRRAALGANEHVVAGIDGDRVDVSAPGLAAPLQLRADVRREQRLATEGADPALQAGILNVNGRDLGAVFLPER